MSVPETKLLIVANRVHTALNAKNLTHFFLGGLELILLGCDRSTTDVDVEVKKQMFSTNNLKTIKAAFSDTTLFRVMDGSRDDGFRMLCNANDDLTPGQADWVGVDVLSRGPDRLPKQKVFLHGLPFLSITDLIVEKIRCCAQRKKARDATDVIWLVKTMQDNFTPADVCERIKPEVATAALSTHPNLASVLSSLGLVSSSA